MTNLIYEFFKPYNQCLNSDLLKHDFEYKTEYTEDSWKDYFGMTSYYTDNEQSVLICKEYHYKDKESVFEFTDFAIDYIKQKEFKLFESYILSDVSEEDDIDWYHEDSDWENDD